MTSQRVACIASYSYFFVPFTMSIRSSNPHKTIGFLSSDFKACYFTLAATHIAHSNFKIGPSEFEIRGHGIPRSEEHTSELQSRFDLVCRLLLEKKNIQTRCSR